MEEQSTNIVQMDSDVSVTGVSEGSSEFVRIKQEVDLPEDDTYYPMDFGISVEDEEEMNPVYIKMKSKESGSMGKDGSNSSEEEDSEESEGESEEEKDEESSGSEEEKSGDEDVDRDQGWDDSYGVRDEEIHQPSTSSLRLGPILTEMSPVVIKEEPVSDDDEAGGLSYLENAEQFAESYKMLESLRKSSRGNESRQFDSQTAAFGKDGPFMERQENLLEMSQEHGKQLGSHTVSQDTDLPMDDRDGVQECVPPFQRRDVEQSVGESSDAYFCSLCQKPCGNRTNYLVHLRIKHAKEMPHECEVCELRFSRETKLLDHMLSSHGGEKRGINKCDVCGMRFSNKHDLHAHMLTHNEYAPFPCPVCRKTHVTKKDLRKHLLSHREKKTFPCPKCPRVFARARRLEAHLKGPCNPLICEDCSRKPEVSWSSPCFKKPEVSESPASDNTSNLASTSVPQENSVEQEEVTPSSELQLSCEKCGTAFANQEDSIGHKCKVYRCSICSKHFSCPSFIGADGKSRTPVETPMCETCSKAFDLKDSIDTHEDASKVVEKTLRCGVCLKKLPMKIYRACAVKETSTVTETHDSQERFSCRICGYQYLRRYSLLKHVKVHERDNKFVCVTCDMVFNKKKTYKRHMKTHEPGSYECPKCKETFHKEKHLEAHTLLHLVGTHQEYRCVACNMFFTERKAYKQHLKFHDRKIHKCSKCNEAFSKKKHLERHKQLQLEGYNVCNHTANKKKKVEKKLEKLEKCPVCSKYFRSRETLLRHQRSHLPPNERYTCVECWKSFPLKSMLMDHMKIHERTLEPASKYVCSICKLSCVNELHLFNHKRIHAGFKISACDICGESFNTQYNLLKHRESDHSMCKICDKGFLTTEELELHNQEMHAKGHLVCNLCGKVCVNELHLENHQLIHRGAKNLFVCEFCGFGFNHKYKLVEHMESHTGQKPHRCDICGEGFSEASDLLFHRKMHQDHPGLVIGVDFIKNEDTSP